MVFWLLLCCYEKNIMTKGNLWNKRIYFSLESQKDRVCRRTGMAAGTGSWLTTFSSAHWVSKRGIGRYGKAVNLESLHSLLNFLQPYNTHTTPSMGNHVFKDINLWGTFLIQSTKHGFLGHVIGDSVPSLERIIFFHRPHSIQQEHNHIHFSEKKNFLYL